MQSRTIAIDTLKPNPRNAHTHSKKQIDKLPTASNRSVSTSRLCRRDRRDPLRSWSLRGRALQLGLADVPIVTVSGLSAAKKRALALADNKIAEHAGWDRELLASELWSYPLLIEDDLDISITGFDTAEIDLLSADFEENFSDPADEVDANGSATTPSASEVICGDSTIIEFCAVTHVSFHAYPVDGRPSCRDGVPRSALQCPVRDIVGRGHKHREFAMGSGEMSRGEFVEFLTSAQRPRPRYRGWRRSLCLHGLAPHRSTARGR